MTSPEERDRVIMSGHSLLDWLKSIPCVSSGLKPQEGAPLSPEECAAYEAYMRDRSGPAGDAARARSAQPTPPTGDGSGEGS